MKTKETFMEDRSEGLGVDEELAKVFFMPSTFTVNITLEKYRVTT